VQVLFDGIPAQLVSVSRNRVVAVAPTGVRSGMKARVQVVRDYQCSEPFAVAVNEAAPGIFTVSGNGQGAILAWNQDLRLNGESNAAARGNAVTLRVSGLGADAARDEDVHRLRRALAVSVGSQSATVLDARRVWSAAGTYQITIRLPKDGAVGRVFVQLATKQQTSRPGVWLWVK
jgi:uncharacterized protein (TIGR03437 family)